MRRRHKPNYFQYTLGFVILYMPSPPASAFRSPVHRRRAAATAIAMGVVTRAQKRRLEQEEQDRISGLPDGVLGDIVSLLPTKDGARTQLLSSRWRPLWRAAPLHVDLHLRRKSLHRTPAGDVPRILSAHPAPGRRFSVHIDHAATTADLDGWLRSPAVDNLRELEIHFDTALLRWGTPPLPLPASALRFSSTLCVANFYACVFPDGSNSNATGRVLQWPLLKQLTLSSVTISEGSLLGLLAGCHGLESLLLDQNEGFTRVKIVSSSLIRIGVCSRWGYDDDEPRLKQVVIEDAPCMERLVIFEGLEMDISVISAPRLSVLGKLHGDCHMIQFGTRGLQVSEAVVGLAAVVPNLRVLALSYVKPCLVINLMKCFPYLEKLHVEIEPVKDKDKPYDRYQKLTGALDIRLRKIVLSYYHDSKAYIDFAKFFVMNASMLELMRLELKPGDIGKDDVWIRRQRRLLKIGKRASRGARFDFVSRSGSHSLSPEKQVHDMSILDPFDRIHY